MSEASTRDRILAAAAEELRSSSYRWDQGLVVQRIAERAELTEDTIYKTFGSKAGLLGELIDLLASPGMSGEASWTTEQLTQDRKELADAYDGSEEVFAALISRALSATIEDPTFMSQVFLLSQADRDERIRRRLAEGYAAWDETISSGMRRAFEEGRNFGAHQRRGLDADEVAVLLSALIEGLALRAKVSPELVTPELATKAVIGLFSRWISFDDDTAPFADGLDEYIRRRNSWQGE